MEKENIVIFSAKVARDLIRKGFIVVDIRPNTRDRRKTAFYFKETVEIKELLNTEYQIKIN